MTLLLNRRALVLFTGGWCVSVCLKLVKWCCRGWRGEKFTTTGLYHKSPSIQWREKGWPLPQISMDTMTPNREASTTDLHRYSDVVQGTQISMNVVQGNLYHKSPWYSDVEKGDLHGYCGVELGSRYRPPWIECLFYASSKLFVFNVFWYITSYNEVPQIYTYTSGGSRNFEKGGPTPQIAKNSRILGFKF
jgi:hypothetical protein